MSEAIKQVFKKIDINIIFKTIYLLSIIFVFFPNFILKKLNLLGFKTNYQFVFSLSFIILTCYYIILVINWVFEKIKINIALNNRIKNFENLTNEEKKYLMCFYDFETNTFKTSYQFDITEGTVALLENKMIIMRASSLSCFNTKFSFILQPWAFKIMEKKLLAKQIDVFPSIGPQQNHENYKFKWM